MHTAGKVVHTAMHTAGAYGVYCTVATVVGGATQNFDPFTMSSGSRSGSPSSPAS